METDPDVVAMLAVQQGDLSAFDRLFTRHAAALIAFAGHFVGSRARAEEITQDVFLQVFRNRANYQPTAKFVTWLYRIATNACLSEVRRSEHRHVVRPSRHDDAPPFEPADPSGATPEDKVRRQETLSRMRQALADLPEPQRAALLLARVDGFSYEQVAEALSTTVPAVKSMIHRATLALRAAFPDRGDE